MGPIPNTCHGKANITARGRGRGGGEGGNGEGGRGRGRGKGVTKKKDEGREGTVVCEVHEVDEV